MAKKRVVPLVNPKSKLAKHKEKLNPFFSYFERRRTQRFIEKCETDFAYIDGAAERLKKFETEVVAGGYAQELKARERKLNEQFAAQINEQSKGNITVILNQENPKALDFAVRVKTGKNKTTAFNFRNLSDFSHQYKAKNSPLRAFFKKAKLDTQVLLVLKDCAALSTIKERVAKGEEVDLHTVGGTWNSLTSGVMDDEFVDHLESLTRIVEKKQAKKVDAQGAVIQGEKYEYRFMADTWTPEDTAIILRTLAHAIRLGFNDNVLQQLIQQSNINDADAQKALVAFIADQRRLRLRVEHDRKNSDNTQIFLKVLPPEIAYIDICEDINNAPHKKAIHGYILTRNSSQDWSCVYINSDGVEQSIDIKIIPGLWDILAHKASVKEIDHVDENGTAEGASAAVKPDAERKSIQLAFVNYHEKKFPSNSQSDWVNVTQHVVLAKSQESQFFSDNNKAAKQLISGNNSTAILSNVFSRINAMEAPGYGRDRFSLPFPPKQGNEVKTYIAKRIGIKSKDLPVLPNNLNFESADVDSLIAGLNQYFSIQSNQPAKPRWLSSESDKKKYAQYFLLKDKVLPVLQEIAGYHQKFIQEDVIHTLNSQSFSTGNNASNQTLVKHVKKAQRQYHAKHQYNTLTMLQNWALWAYAAELDGQEQALQAYGKWIEKFQPGFFLRLWKRNAAKLAKNLKQKNQEKQKEIQQLRQAVANEMVVRVCKYANTSDQFDKEDLNHYIDYINKYGTAEDKEVLAMRTNWRAHFISLLDIGNDSHIVAARERIFAKAEESLRSAPTNNRSSARSANTNGFDKAILILGKILRGEVFDVDTALTEDVKKAIEEFVYPSTQIQKWEQDLEQLKGTDRQLYFACKEFEHKLSAHHNDYNLQSRFAYLVKEMATQNLKRLLNDPCLKANNQNSINNTTAVKVDILQQIIKDKDKIQTWVKLLDNFTPDALYADSLLEIYRNQLEKFITNFDYMLSRLFEPNTSTPIGEKLPLTVDQLRYQFLLIQVVPGKKGCRNTYVDKLNDHKKEFLRKYQADNFYHDAIIGVIGTGNDKTEYLIKRFEHFFANGVLSTLKIDTELSRELAFFDEHRAQVQAGVDNFLAELYKKYGWSKKLQELVDRLASQALCEQVRVEKVLSLLKARESAAFDEEDMTREENSYLHYLFHALNLNENNFATGQRREVFYQGLQAYLNDQYTLPQNKQSSATRPNAFAEKIIFEFTDIESDKTENHFRSRFVLKDLGDRIDDTERLQRFEKDLGKYHIAYKKYLQAGAWLGERPSEFNVVLMDGSIPAATSRTTQSLNVEETGNPPIKETGAVSEDARVPLPLIEPGFQQTYDALIMHQAGASVATNNTRAYAKAHDPLLARLALKSGSRGLQRELQLQQIASHLALPTESIWVYLPQDNDNKLNEVAAELQTPAEVCIAERYNEVIKKKKVIKQKPLIIDGQTYERQTSTAVEFEDYRFYDRFDTDEALTEFIKLLSSLGVTSIECDYVRNYWGIKNDEKLYAAIGKERIPGLAQLLQQRLKKEEQSLREYKQKLLTAGKYDLRVPQPENFFFLGNRLYTKAFDAIMQKECPGQFTTLITDYEKLKTEWSQLNQFSANLRSIILQFEQAAGIEATMNSPSPLVRKEPKAETRVLPVIARTTKDFVAYVAAERENECAKAAIAQRIAQHATEEDKHPIKVVLDKLNESLQFIINHMGDDPKNGQLVWRDMLIRQQLEMIKSAVIYFKGAYCKKLFDRLFGQFEEILQQNKKEYFASRLNANEKLFPLLDLIEKTAADIFTSDVSKDYQCLEARVSGAGLWLDSLNKILVEDSSTNEEIYYSHLSSLLSFTNLTTHLPFLTFEEKKQLFKRINSLTLSEGKTTLINKALKDLLTNAKEIFEKLLDSTPDNGNNTVKLHEIYGAIYRLVIDAENSKENKEIIQLIPKLTPEICQELFKKEYFNPVLMDRLLMVCANAKESENVNNYLSLLKVIEVLGNEGQKQQALLIQQALEFFQEYSVETLRQNVAVVLDNVSKLQPILKQLPEESLLRQKLENYFSEKAISDLIEKVIADSANNQHFSADLSEKLERCAKHPDATERQKKQAKAILHARKLFADGAQGCADQWFINAGKYEERKSYIAQCVESSGEYLLPKNTVIYKIFDLFYTQERERKQERHKHAKELAQFFVENIKTISTTGGTNTVKSYAAKQLLSSFEKNFPTFRKNFSKGMYPGVEEVLLKEIKDQLGVDSRLARELESQLKNVSITSENQSEDRVLIAIKSLIAEYKVDLTSSEKKEPLLRTTPVLQKVTAEELDENISALVQWITSHEKFSADMLNLKKFVESGGANAYQKKIASLETAFEALRGDYSDFSDINYFSLLNKIEESGKQSNVSPAVMECKNILQKHLDQNPNSTFMDALYAYKEAKLSALRTQLSFMAKAATENRADYLISPSKKQRSSTQEEIEISALSVESAEKYQKKITDFALSFKRLAKVDRISLNTDDSRKAYATQWEDLCGAIDEFYQADYPKAAKVISDFSLTKMFYEKLADENLVTALKDSAYSALAAKRKQTTKGAKSVTLTEIIRSYAAARVPEQRVVLRENSVEEVRVPAASNLPQRSQSFSGGFGLFTTRGASESPVVERLINSSGAGVSPSRTLSYTED